MTTVAEARGRYATWVQRTGFADSTRDLYAARVGSFLDWLDAAGEEYAGALDDAHLRDYAVRDYRRVLMVEQKRAPATVELAMSAIGSLYDYLGLGKPNVTRQGAKRRDPKALEGKDLTAVLRGLERRGPRDFALGSILFLTAVRVSEAHALDTDDLFISDRMGQLDVRYGKGGQSRRVPVPADARAALRPWLAERQGLYGPQPGPLFVSREGTRLSVRRIQSMVQSVGKQAGVDVSPHVLRHTFARNFLDAGGDLGALQLHLGHRNLSSTQVYTQPPEARLAELSENVRMHL